MRGLRKKTIFELGAGATLGDAGFSKKCSNREQEAGRPAVQMIYHRD
jgi:hypothetical protein